MKRREKPYWNFWKVVFAGWLIRYPMIFFKTIFVIVFVSWIGLMCMISETSNELTGDKYQGIMKTEME